MAKPKFQERFSELHPETMYDEAARAIKAGKALAILEAHLGSLEGLRHLDVGCSTGFMTRLYAARFASSVGVDIDASAIAFASSRNAAPNVSYRVADASHTELPSDSFDVVTCTHIYEHVPDSRQLLDEIYRVLKPGGCCFFSAGNRFVLLEPHYRLPLLSVIPKSLAHVYVRASGRAKSYYENHLSYWGLRRLVDHFKVVDYTRRAIEDPVRYSATDMVAPGSLKQRLALALLSSAYWLCPTYLWILEKPRA